MFNKKAIKPYRKPLIKSSKVKPISLYYKKSMPGIIDSETPILAAVVYGE